MYIPWQGCRIDKIKVIFFFLAILFIIQPGSSAIFLNNGSDISGARLIEVMNNVSNLTPSPFPIHFFYNTHCGSCKPAVRFMDNFTIRHPDVGVKFHDLYNNTESFGLYEEAKKQYNKTDLYYPVIFVGNVGIMGSTDIENYTELLILWYQKHRPSNPLSEFITRFESITSSVFH